MNKNYFVLRRIFSSLFDLLFIVIVFSIFVIYPITNLISAINNNSSISQAIILLILMILGAICVCVFSFSAMLSSSWKATVGMRLFNLVLTTSSHRDLNFGRIVLRETYTIISIVLSCGLSLITSLFLIIFNDKSKTFSDVCTYTKVVDSL